MNSTTENAPRKRSRGRTVLGLIVSIVAVYAGFGIMTLMGERTDPSGGEKAFRIVFGILWFTFWIAALAYHILKLAAFSAEKRSQKPRTRAAGTAAGTAPGEAEATKAEFETRLRGLESLKKDGLLSEEEYQRKREELLREKW